MVRCCFIFSPLTAGIWAVSYLLAWILKQRDHDRTYCWWLRQAMFTLSPRITVQDMRVSKNSLFLFYIWMGREGEVVPYISEMDGTWVWGGPLYSTDGWGGRARWCPVFHRWMGRDGEVVPYIPQMNGTWWRGNPLYSTDGWDVRATCSPIFQRRTVCEVEIPHRGMGREDEIP